MQALSRIRYFVCLIFLVIYPCKDLGYAVQLGFARIVLEFQYNSIRPHSQTEISNFHSKSSSSAFCPIHRKPFQTYKKFKSVLCSSAFSYCRSVARLRALLSLSSIQLLVFFHLNLVSQICNESSWCSSSDDFEGVPILFFVFSI